MTAAPPHRGAVTADDAPHILVVDDDDRIRVLLGRFLGEHGFRVTRARSAAEARERMRALAFDLVVLDVMMPGETGLELAAALKARSDQPVLFLTARADAEDRIAGLETGADDYLAKPFDPRELLLRIRNVLKRAGGRAAAHEPAVFGPFVYDSGREELRRGDAVVRLTEREHRLMRIFAAARDAVVAREALLEGEGAASERAVDVQINRLRRKIEDDPANPVHLTTIRGVGYRLRLDGRAP